MNCHITGPDAGRELLLILGWGNRIESENVQWLVDLFADDGYCVHTLEIQDHITSFDREYLDPVQSYGDDLGQFKLVCHSTGGLIGAHLEGGETRTYLSPWWGIHPSQEGPLLDLLLRLPTTKRFVPNTTDTREKIGRLATEDQLAAIPDFTSPVFLDEIVTAQQNRPEIDDEAAVFCSLCDDIVSVRAIGEAVPPEQIALYQGAHELFSSPNRDAYTAQLLAAVEDGVEGVR